MEPRVLFFRVGVFSDSFFVSQPFAAPVDDFPAIGESRAFEQPQHGLVVEVGVDAEGFDYMDRKLLLAVIDKFFGGPVGLDNLAAAIGEERETIEDVLEPYLIQQGFLQRTPRGRMATVRAWNHFGITPPEMP